MASSSSSSRSAPASYDVFLSFRGEDTHNTFVEHLYSALIQRQIHTYIDDETLPRGVSITQSLLKTIRQSQIAVIIFSKNYADSSWFLEELEYIMECKDETRLNVLPVFYDVTKIESRRKDHMVFPIFYHVDPTNVRKQQNSFGNAMAEHGQKKMDAETNTEKRVRWGEKMDRWNKALTDVADLKWKDVKGRPPSLDEVSPHRWLPRSLCEEIMQILLEEHKLLKQKTDSNKNLRYKMDDDWEFEHNTSLQTSRSPRACEARDIAEKLQFGKRPPSLDEVSPISLLSRSECEEIRQIFLENNKLLKQMTDLNRNLRNDMQKVKWGYFGFDEWKSGVPSEMFEDLAPSILDLLEEVFSDTKSSFERKINLSILETLEESAPSISDLPIEFLSDMLSLTSPGDACRAAAVSNLFKDIADSDYVWHKLLPLDLHEIIARAVSNVVFHSQKELYFLLSDSYILLDRGTLAFKLDKESGKKCYMLASRHLSIAWHDDKRYWEWGHMPESRFAEVGMLKEVWCLDIHGIITTAMLSPKTMYVAYLVFLTTRWSSGLNVPAKTIVTVGGIRNETSYVYLQRPGTKAQPQVSHTMRKDGWMEIPLGEFYRDDGDEGEVEMVFEELVYWKAGLIVEGIEVRPK